MKEKLSIVIPCKDEEDYIGSLLESLKSQKGISGVTIIIADAGSTDKTLSIIEEYTKFLKIKLIRGGLPAKGRNRGLNLSKTKWTLFIDSDISIRDKNLLEKAIEKCEKKDLHILGAKLNSDHLLTKLIYKLNNFLIRLSFFDKPFIVGSFCLVNTAVAKELGGFPTWALHCEDYLFSKRISGKKAGFLNRSVWSDNRRFKKMGYFNMVKYVFKNTLERNNEEYFKKDVSYWS